MSDQQQYQVAPMPVFSSSNPIPLNNPNQAGYNQNHHQQGFNNANNQILDNQDNRKQLNYFRCLGCLCPCGDKEPHSIVKSFATCEVIVTILLIVNMIACLANIVPISEYVSDSYGYYDFNEVPVFFAGFVGLICSLISICNCCQSLKTVKNRGQTVRLLKETVSGFICVHVVRLPMRLLMLFVGYSLQDDLDNSEFQRVPGLTRKIALNRDVLLYYQIIPLIMIFGQIVSLCNYNRAVMRFDENIVGVGDINYSLNQGD